MKEIREAKAAINTNNIILAGKALKTVVFTLLIMIGLLFSFYIIQPDISLQILYFIIFVCNIIILISLYDAGDKLVNVLKENLSDPKSTMLDELLKSEHETIEQTSESGDTLNDTSLK